MLSTITKTVTKACRIMLGCSMIAGIYMVGIMLRTTLLCVKWGLAVPVSRLHTTLESASAWLVNCQSKMASMLRQ